MRRVQDEIGIAKHMTIAHEQRDLRSRGNVAHAPQLRGGNALRLLIESNVKARAIEGVTNGYGVRVAISIGSHEPGGTLRTHECGLSRG